MFVLTIDRRASRREQHGPSMREQRHVLQSHLPRPALDWDINAGDELQALYDDAARVLDAVLALALTDRWHVGLGIGAVDLPLAGSVRESTGPAFIAARDAVNAAKDLETPAVRGDAWAERSGAVLALLCAVRARRSAAGREAAELADAGLTQLEIAERLGIGQSSVSRRLRAAMWQQDVEARQALVALLELADADSPAGHDPSGPDDTPGAAPARPGERPSEPPRAAPGLGASAAGATS
ncbi:winged helix-turn-helix transcriptional regulator [Kocuria tytonis]|uniref:Winged helix-turn-helix transcriptional regulator n=1 Tax=Kocuria tytonis TaxID=2054280 RepID=A0A495AAP8_9MICC|nr:winged helix-turn-helix transcriptional regulator [Kocuria tytonis]RKQ36474.1 winged helix-turn-helix transcriptional regulator [Kocuria tytonis]